MAVLLVSAVAGCATGKSEAQTGTPSTQPGSAGQSSGRGQKGIKPPPPGSGLARYYEQKVEWKDCEKFKCAKILVPLDYAKPDDKAITIVALKRPATGQRQGTLFVNPGGPGQSGANYVEQGFQPGPAVTQAYDIVGFDPRGVGLSTPVDCLTDAELDEASADDILPNTPEDEQKLFEEAKEFGQKCKERSPEIAAHMSTVEAARDMDILRAVEKEDQIDYYGASYGTYLGATYAGLFPDKVDRFVLDAAVDPGDTLRQKSLRQAAGFQVALEAYLKDCTASQKCPLGTTVEQAQQKIIDMLQQVEQNPVPLKDGRKFTVSHAFDALTTPLYSKDMWPVLTQALDAWGKGDPSMMVKIADLKTKRVDGKYLDNSNEAIIVINCTDKPTPVTLEQARAEKQQFSQASPVFGPFAAMGDFTCNDWPLKAAEPHPDYAAKGAKPIVVIGTTRDPATPYQQAVTLSDTLSSGVLVTFDGDGHGAYLKGKNQCIDKTIDAYLVEGRVPQDKTKC